MNFLQTKTIRQGIIWLTYLTMFLGAYVSTSLFFPFITGKNFAFRTIVELMLLAYVLLALSNKEYRPYKNKPLLLYFAFIVGLFVANIFGSNPANSFWSNFERMEGFVTHLHLFVFTSILIFIKISRAEWIKMLKVFLLGNAAVLLFAYLEIIKISSKLAQGEVVATRIAGSLGNPAYLAIAAVFGFFVAVLLYISRKNEASLIEKTLYISSAILNLFLIWRSETRGTIVGIFCAVLFSAVYLIYKNNKNRKARNIGILVILFTFFAVAFVYSIKGTYLAETSPTLKRLSEISFNEQTVRSRFMIWEMSLVAAQKNPILGYGQENFIYPFSKYYNPEMFDQEQWFDRSHNVFMDWLIAGGLVVLVLYLSIFAVTFRKLFVSRGFDDNQKLVLAALLITYFVHNIFVFDNLISYISFFLIFAFINSNSDQKIKEQNKKIDTNLNYLIFAAIFFLVGIFWYKSVYEPYRLNKNITKMYMSVVDQSKENLERQITNLSQNVLFGTHEAREQLYMLASIISNSKSLDDTSKQELLRKIFTLGLEEAKNDPDNPRPLVIMASYLKGEDAVSLYEKALRLTPNKVYLWLSLSESYEESGNLENAILAAKTSHDLSNRSMPSTIRLASLYYKNSQNSLAEEAWQKTIKANNFSQEVFIKRAAFYKSQNDQKMFVLAKEDIKQNFPEISSQVDEVFK